MLKGLKYNWHIRWYCYQEKFSCYNNALELLFSHCLDDNLVNQENILSAKDCVKYKLERGCVTDWKWVVTKTVYLFVFVKKKTKGQNWSGFLTPSGWWFINVWLWSTHWLVMVKGSEQISWQLISQVGRHMRGWETPTKEKINHSKVYLNAWCEAPNKLVLINLHKLLNWI